MLLYLFFGGLSFVVSVVTYGIFNLAIGLNELIANVISWIITVTFAFLPIAYGYSMRRLVV